MCSFLFTFQLGEIIYNVSFELIRKLMRKLTVKQRAHKKVDYKTKYF